MVLWNVTVGGALSGAGRLPLLPPYRPPAFFYHTLVLHTLSQAQSLLVTLTADPPSPAASAHWSSPPRAPSQGRCYVASARPSARSTSRSHRHSPHPTPPPLCAALSTLHTLRTLTVRKAAGSYLFQSAPRPVSAA
ncbi:hypothetical protein DFH09DRAFT_1338493 [Mycena vulgaris]|nr:hypothetical protein DFH09DRAFT_1338493 [Mycena vulgaris]